MTPFRALCLAWLFVGCATLAPPRKGSPLNTVEPMKVVSLPSPKDPIVSFRWVFRAGSVDDPKGLEGLTALTSQLLAEGGTLELSASELMDALFPMAAEFHVSTDKEFTVFSGRVHQDRVERFLKIFADTLLEPRFDPNEFERLRSDAQSYLQNSLRGEDDETLGKVALDELLYPNHPYRHAIQGTVTGLARITLEDVKKHWKAVFTQDRLVVGISAADTEKRVTQVKSRLAALPKTGAPIVSIPPPLPSAPSVRILKKDTLSTAISMGYAYPLRRDHKDYFAVALALSYFGEHRQFHGTLFQELREKRGLNYGDYAYVEHFHQDGWSTQPRVNVGRTQQDFSIWLRPVAKEHSLFATRGALYFLKQLGQKPPDEEKLQTAKGFLLGTTRLWEQTAQRRLGYAIDELFYGTPRFLETYRRALANLTPEDIHQAVQKHLSVDRLNFVFVTQEAEKLKMDLAQNAPSPRVYPTPPPKELTQVDEKIEVFPLALKPEQISIVPADQFMEK